MKRIVLTLTLVALVTNLFAQNANYQQAMGENLSKYATAKTVADYQGLSNQFELIANNEKEDWLPLYYAAHSTILMVQNGVEKEKIDSYLDHAQKFIDKAVKIAPDESEIHVLQGFLHQARISVDFMGRGTKYVAMAQECFEKAKAMNPENPRIYYLSALSVYNTPKMFGGGKKNALPLFEQAKVKFDVFNPSSVFSPNWGKGNNEALLAECKK